MELNLNIEKKDVNFIKDFLKSKEIPVELNELARQISLLKTQDSRTNKVKIYDPNCEYKVNDLIYKDYPGKIPVGSKKYIEINGGVVLKAVELRTRYGINEIKLRYEGTSEFKKYADYLEKQKIELLLPHKQKKPVDTPEYLTAEQDPRMHLAPLLDRDFNLLKKKLIASLNKESDLSLICDKVLLNDHIKPVSSEIIVQVKEFFNEHKKSKPTEFLVETFLNIKPENPDFSAYCFALNYKMIRDYKIDFQQTNDQGWGKWNLISVIYYIKKDSLVSEENPLVTKLLIDNKKNLHQRRKKFEDSLFAEEANKFFLTEREITAGALKLYPGTFDFGNSIEIEMIDSSTKQTYNFYYYKDVGLVIGFKEIFKSYKSLQGMILTLSHKENQKPEFTIRTSKKGTIGDKIVYNPEKKVFQIIDEKIASPVFVNKVMFLEADIFKKLEEKIEEFRKLESLNQLVHKIFLEFGMKEKNYEIHILKLYHILDIIYPIDLRIVIDILLSSPEFISSEKITGIFYLDSDALKDIEKQDIQRKENLIEVEKIKQDEQRQQVLDEERKKRDEIRRKREDRRKQRETEMWMKEKIQQDKETRRPEAAVLETSSIVLEKKSPKPDSTPVKASFSGSEKIAEKAKDTSIRKKEAPNTKEILSPEELPAKETHFRKTKKKELEEEKLPKSPKKVDRKTKDDQIDLTDLKNEIALEELKEQMEAKKIAAQKKKEAKIKEIAYKDKGGFGNIFASKLDEIVKKKKD